MSYILSFLFLCFYTLENMKTLLNARPALALGREGSLPNSI